MSQAGTENGKRPASTSTRTRRPKAAAPTESAVEPVVQAPDSASIEAASAPVAPAEPEEPAEDAQTSALEAVEAVAATAPTQPEAATEDDSSEATTAIRLKIDCQQLLRAVEKAGTAVAGSKGAPSLQSLMIQANQADQTLTVTGYNLKVCLKAVVQAQVEQGGEFLITATCLTSLLGQMPEETYLNLDSASTPGLLQLSCAGIQYQERVQPTDSYPELPVLDERFIPAAQQYSLSAVELGTGLSAVLFAADRDESKPTHAVLLQLWRGGDGDSEDGFALIATNSGCAALYTVTEKWHDLAQPDRQFLLPLDAVPSIKKMCFAAESVSCCFDEDGKLLQFAANVPQPDDSSMTICAMIRLREWATYPPVRRSLPDLSLDAVTATVDYRQLSEAIGRQEATRSKLLMLEVSFDQITLLTIGGERERQVAEQIAADNQRSGSIPLPIQQLAQALKAVECEQVGLCLDSQLAQNLLVGDGREHRLTLRFIDRPLQIMMMRVRNADPSATSPQPKSTAGKTKASTSRRR